MQRIKYPSSIEKMSLVLIPYLPIDSFEFVHLESSTQAVADSYTEEAASQMFRRRDDPPDQKRFSILSRHRQPLPLQEGRTQKQLLPLVANELFSINFIGGFLCLASRKKKILLN